MMLVTRSLKSFSRNHRWKYAMSNDVVKSVGRVLEVLEFFGEEKRALNATDIGARFGYPKSSCNALLKSLVSLGYLTVDTRTTHYFPTLRVAKLGDWLPAALFGEVRMNVLEELHAETGETVTLSIRNGFSMQFVSVLPGTFPITLAIEEGFMFSLFGTAVGTALLSTYPDARLKDLFARAEKAGVSRAKNLPLADILKNVRKARRKGYAVGYDRILPDTAAIAMPLPGAHEGGALVIGVGGLSPRIRQAEKDIIAKMWSLISSRENAD